MSVIGDLLAALDRLPIWKTLKEMPARVDALEKRVADLERQLSARPAAEACPLCGSEMKVTGVVPHRTFGDLGVQERTYACTNARCGHTEGQMHDPAGRVGKKR